MLSEEKIHELIASAIAARENSYAPYSHYQVGAALLVDNGQIIMGCNIENAAYTPTNCAERTAFFRAVYEGEREFTKIAVVGGPEGSDADELCAPCGVCRQVMMEFCDPETFQIILADGSGRCLQRTLKEMLPFGFGPENLGNS